MSPLKEEAEQARQHLMRVAYDARTVFEIYTELEGWPRVINGEEVSFDEAEAATKKLRDEHAEALQNALAVYAYHLRRAL